MKTFQVVLGTGPAGQLHCTQNIWQLHWKAICGTCLPSLRCEARHARFEVESEDESP